MPIASGSSGNADVAIAVAGTAVQLIAVSTPAMGFMVFAYEDNVQPIVLGIGSGTKFARGFYFRKFRPGDWQEFQASDFNTLSWVDISDFWINNDAVTGHAGDGVAVVKLGHE